MQQPTRSASFVSLINFERMGLGDVDALADALVGAGIGSRRSPFASFTKKSVSDIVSLAYATEAKEVGALCAAIRTTKPEAPAAKVTVECE